MKKSYTNFNFAVLVAILMIPNVYQVVVGVNGNGPILACVLSLIVIGALLHLHRRQ